MHCFYCYVLGTSDAGSVISIFMENPDQQTFYSKIAAPVTDTEMRFMRTFGIDDGDGIIELKEFIILVIVRISSIDPSVIARITERYQELDAHQDGKLAYSVIVPGHNGSVSGQRSDGIMSSPLRAIRRSIVQTFQIAPAGSIPLSRPSPQPLLASSPRKRKGCDRISVVAIAPSRPDDNLDLISSISSSPSTHPSTHLRLARSLSLSPKKHSSSATVSPTVEASPTEDIVSTLPSSPWRTASPARSCLNGGATRGGGELPSSVGLSSDLSAEWKAGNGSEGGDGDAHCSRGQTTATVAALVQKSDQEGDDHNFQSMDGVRPVESTEDVGTSRSLGCTDTVTGPHVEHGGHRKKTMFNKTVRKVRKSAVERAKKVRKVGKHLCLSRWCELIYA